MRLPLFVYGTLRDPDVLRLVIGRLPAAAETRPATAIACRAVYFPQRTYPALVADPAATAPGLLLTGLSAAECAVLDLFEGDEYARSGVDVMADGQTQAAEAYWPAQAIPATAPGWRIEDWTARHKAAFLAREASTTEQLRRQLTDLPYG